MNNTRAKQHFRQFVYLTAAGFFAAGCSVHTAQTGPAMNMLEYAPASNPTIIGSVNSFIDSTPNI